MFTVSEPQRFDTVGCVLGHWVSLIPRPLIPTASLVYVCETCDKMLRILHRTEWFDIDSNFENKIQAFSDLYRKTSYRLIGKHELHEVRDILYGISKFTYAFLPNHRRNLKADELVELHNQGIEALNSIVHAINKLPDYNSERKISGLADSDNQKKFVDKIDRHTRDFVGAFIVSVPVFAAILYLLGRVWPFNPDIMAPTIVGFGLTFAYNWSKRSS